MKLHFYLQDMILKLQLSFKRENTGFKKGEGYWTFYRVKSKGEVFTSHDFKSICWYMSKANLAPSIEKFVAHLSGIPFWQIFCYKNDVEVTEYQISIEILIEDLKTTTRKYKISNNTSSIDIDQK